MGSEQIIIKGETMNSSFALLGVYFMRWLPVIAGLGLLVTGIMITAGKEKSVKVLGIGYILSSVPVILSSLATIFIHISSAKAYSAYAVWNSYLSLFCNIGFLVCVCIFLHRKYGKKLIYIPVLAVSIGGTVITRIVSILLAKGLGSRDNYLWISMTLQINSFVTDAAVALIIIIVFYMNRKNEDLIPKTWLCMTIGLAGSALRALTYVAYYLTLINNFRIRSSSENMISLAVAFTALFAVVTPLYITIMAYRKDRP